MNNDKQLFRQALQRQNERAAGMKMPEDMEQRVMRGLSPRPLQEERKLKRKSFSLSWRGVGSALIAASILLFLVFRFNSNDEVQPEQQPVLAETIEPNNPQPAPQHIIEEKKEEKPQQPNKSHKTNKPSKPNKSYKQLASATDSTPRLTTTADSLYYYLTQLENQMGECRDSTCLAELGNLMRANERIKGLVNKILHKEIETAFQEEYLVDTTTRYIPL